MLLVGIDWADDHHDICVINEQGQELKHFQISNDSEGFLNLLKEVQTLEVEAKEIAFCLEKSHGLLVDFLLDHGFTVYPINPKSAERMRDRHASSKKKDDRFDAFVLADTLRTDRHRLVPLAPDSEIARELRALVQDREHLVQAKTRVVNQMTSCLKEYYPVALEIFSTLQGEIVLTFLKAYSTPEILSHLNFKTFRRFLEEHHYPWKMVKKTPEELYQEVRSPKWQMKPDPVVQKTKSRLLLALIDQLQTLMGQVKQYDQAISELMGQHPDNDIFSSLPGAGEKLGPKLAAHFGEDRKRFKNFESVQRFAGTAPITQQSGTYRHVQRRIACQQSFQNTLFQYAFVTLRRCLWAKKYYQEKRKAGKTHATALRALANKWAKIIFTLWKNRERYQEHIFLASRQQHALLNAS